MNELEKKNKVKPPESLSQKQIRIAKAWVHNSTNERLTIEEFCRKNAPLSTVTFTKWKNKDMDFQIYVNQLQGELITGDEITAYNIIKRDMLRKINSGNYTDAERDFFMKHFEHVIKAEKQKAMKALGLDENSSDSRTVEERKASILARLKG